VVVFFQVSLILHLARAFAVVGVRLRKSARRVDLWVFRFGRGPSGCASLRDPKQAYMTVSGSPPEAARPPLILDYSSLWGRVCFFDDKAHRDVE
jgi:hypothetical protein